MVTVTSVLRRSSTVNFFENGGSSGESSRRPSLADAPSSRRPSLAGLSLRLAPRSKRANSSKDVDTLSDKAAQRLGQAFFSLPDEINVHILCYLSHADIFALRLTSRSLYSFLQSHACPITRAVLAQCAYDRTADESEEDNLVERRAEYSYNFIRTLYPQPTPCTSMDYLLQMLRRQHQIDKMLSVTLSFVQMRIYMMPSCPRFEDFRPYKRKLTRRMHLAAWTIYHFLENYRDILIYAHPEHHPVGEDHFAEGSPPDEPALPSLSSCRQCNESLKSVLRSYPGTEIIPAYHFYDLCRQHLRALSRAPSYAGTIERRLRGWSRKCPTEADLALYVIFGGIPELSKLSMLKGSYSQRIDAIAAFTDKVTSAAISNTLGPHARAPQYAPFTEENTLLPSASFDRLTNSLNVPFTAISHDSVSSIPIFDRFISASDEWITRMFELVKQENQIVTTFGFVQNVLAGKQEPPPPSRGKLDGEVERLTEGGDFDFLAPVKGFD
ncbi:hypothetical protein, variant 1 [Exophiala xenobiotica]|uniref:F-box domain-containing protein n=1 Tax=Exophiala xenobiotica TaxID=348802 RepID=A0A0D2CVN0_9EURO|nr:hypothetical protein, variant 1 [Exophiala xenobiotica]XP_013314742.1 uncharacterized protein PV05_06538 [Exophiala xenobiotica]KIW54156.1 hypothetical protein PV05_06538 [Exophiala xenobiotica]KIW54157.1 hypothetical protein, variant 1 [Exophiala xenobiotica]